MCGICGVLELDGSRAPDPEQLARMRETLRHRGPDAHGQIVAGPAGLAMRRLSVIDVASGQQPLTNEDGSIHLVCNGEIYNYRELRAELVARDHRFRSATDCETVVHAYEEWGLEFLERLNGMFALALWDSPRRRLLLARDRMGIKPLYYAEHAARFYFASEPKAIVAHADFPRALDLESLSQYLSYEYVPTPRSMFAGVRKLRPGHLLVVDLDQAAAGVVERPYARLDLQVDPELAARPEAELAAELWSTLRECVRMELMSDVPLGVFLSGGIDSSAVTAAMVELNPGRVESFSIGFSDPSFDESAHARLVASRLGTRHHELVLEPRMLSDLVPRVMDFLDEPFADASIVPTHLLSRFARESVTVALGGDGGDELFAGYSTLQAHRVAGYYRRLPRFLRERIVRPLVERLPVSYENLSLEFRAKRFLLGMDRPSEQQHQLWLGAFSPEAKRALLAPEALAELASTDCFGVLDEHLEQAHGYDALSRILYLDMKMYLEGDILVKVDRASMGTSLEVRVPLLNRRLVEFAQRLPIELKLKGLTRKYLLKRALRGRIPDSIIDRPKKGFGFPVSKWLTAELRPLLLDLLAEPRLRRQGLFSAPLVTRLVEEHLGARRDHRKSLWPLLMFQLWTDRHLGQVAVGS